MKKIIFGYLLFCFSFKAAPQNVGIGTNTPVGKLEVKGDGNNLSTNTLVLKNSNGDTILRMRNDGRLGIGYNGINYGRIVNIGGNGLNIFKSDVVFSGSIIPTDTSIIMWSEFGPNYYVILQPGWGKVGIGTYSPKRTLHVVGTPDDPTGINPMPDAVIVAEKNGDDAFINILTDGNQSSGIGFGNEFSAAHGGIIYNVGINTYDLRFRTNGNVDRVTIDNTGKMGIGTVTPAEKLDVNGNIVTNGRIELTGELNRTATGAANMMPLCYASISSSGAVNSSSGNLGSVIHSGTGVYQIPINGEIYSTLTHITNVSVVGTSLMRFALVSISIADLQIRIFDITGTLVDNAFHFVVFKQ